ncbi:MAG: hypothetical protein NZ952_06450 [Candidatus Bathyarchaeota archaeon]|nr:hypothetical protein [Candidatus Bathyarchaeota archaeon]
MNRNMTELIGKMLKDDLNRDVGRIISFIIDSSGQIDDVLVEEADGTVSKFPAENLKIANGEVLLISPVGKKIEDLLNVFPVVMRKRAILNKLSDDKVIPPEIYDSLCKEFDKIMKEMKAEAQSLLDEIDKEVKAQDEYIRMLQLSRALLEIEHEIGTVKDEVYQQSLMPILKETKNAQQRKLNLLKEKDKIISVIKGEEIKQPQNEVESILDVKTVLVSEPLGLGEKSEAPKEEAVTVRVTE